MTDIYAVNINDHVSETRIKEFLEIVSAEKRERLHKFRFRNDFLRSLYGDILIRDMIADRTGRKSCDLTFDVNKYGKPCVSNVNDLYYNISHSEDWVVCVISGHPCGIDIEKIATADLGIAKRFFTDGEYQTLLCQSLDTRNDFFYDLWTLKESYLKWKGEGLHTSLQSFEIAKVHDRFYLKYPGDNRVIFKQFKFDDSYKLSLCLEEGECKLHILDVSDLNRQQQFKYML